MRAHTHTHTHTYTHTHKRPNDPQRVIFSWKKTTKKFAFAVGTGKEHRHS